MVAQTLTNPAENRPPVSLHPAFPAIVALWFAALLGLGSMVIPVALLENIVITTGLSAILPGAEPPLGFTARGLIALVAAAAGAVAGMFLARRVAQSHRPQPSNRLIRIAGASTRRPINAHEELGGEGLLAGINRRRSLSMTDESGPSDFLAQAPVPGAAAEHDFDASFDTGIVPTAQPFETAAPEMAAFETASEAEQAPEPFDLLDLGEELVPDDDFAAEPFSAEPYFADHSVEHKPIESVKMDETRELRPSSVFRGEFRPETAPADVGPETPVAQELTADTAALGALGLPQLAEQLGRSIERRRQALARAAAKTLPVAAPFAAPAPEAAAASAATPIPEPAPVVPSAPAFANPDLQVAARPEEAAQAMAAYFGKPAAIGTAREMPAITPLAEAEPDALVVPTMPAGFPSFLGLPQDDGEEADELAASFSLPLRTRPSLATEIEDDDTAPSDLAVRQPPVVDGEDDEDDTFSSLLSLNNPYTPRTPTFVRVDEPEDDDMPVEASVVFPGQDAGPLRHGPLSAAEGSAPRPFDRPGTSPAVSRTAPGQMDDALRSALTKLQRMSGAA